MLLRETLLESAIGACVLGASCGIALLVFTIGLGACGRCLTGGLLLCVALCVLLSDDPKLDTSLLALLDSSSCFTAS